MQLVMQHAASIGVPWWAVGLWLACLVWVLRNTRGQASGLQALLESFPDDDELSIYTIKTQWGEFRKIGSAFKSIALSNLSFDITKNGIRISDALSKLQFPKPIFVPWLEIRSEEINSRFHQLTFGRGVGTVLIIRKDTFEKIAENSPHGKLAR